MALWVVVEEILIGYGVRRGGRLPQGLSDVYWFAGNGYGRGRGGVERGCQKVVGCAGASGFAGGGPTWRYSIRAGGIVSNSFDVLLVLCVGKCPVL